MNQINLTQLLASREERVKRQRDLLARSEGLLVSVTLNIPGAIKDKPAYRKALEIAMEKLENRIPRENILERLVRFPVTGPEGYLAIRNKDIGDAGMTCLELKALTVELEEESRLGRLFDIDVLTDDGSVSRTQLGIPPRTCLLCDEDARVCARSRRHPMDCLLTEIEKILRESGIVSEYSDTSAGESADGCN